MNSLNEIENEDIDLLEVLKSFWKNKILILLITLLFAIFSVSYSLSLPNIYTSSALLQINTNDSSNQVSDLASRYGGLASLAGISMPVTGSDKSSYVKETLLSRQFIEHLISFPNVKENLMASKSFNSQEGVIEYDLSLYDPKNKKWIREVPRGKTVIPSYLEVHKELKKMISINQDDNSGFLLIDFDHISPIFAYEFLTLMINEVNKIILDRDLNEAKQSLIFLQKKLIETNEKDIRTSINNLIGSQLQIIMLASVGDEYILKAIDRPFIPEEKTSPSRSLICISLTILGFIFSLIIVLLKTFLIRKI